MLDGKNMWAYDSICEAEELLFLLLSLLKMSLDQSLEFRQVLLHALAVNVLRVPSKIHLKVELGICQETFKCAELTSKSTFSPSGILGADKLDTKAGLRGGEQLKRYHLSAYVDQNYYLYWGKKQRFSP